MCIVIVCFPGSDVTNFEIIIFIIFKGFSLKQIQQIFLEGESLTLVFEALRCGAYWRMAHKRGGHLVKRKIYYAYKISKVYVLV